MFVPHVVPRRRGALAQLVTTGIGDCSAAGRGCRPILIGASPATTGRILPTRGGPAL